MDLFSRLHGQSLVQDAIKSSAVAADYSSMDVRVRTDRVSLQSCCLAWQLPVTYTSHANVQAVLACTLPGANVKTMNNRKSSLDCQ